MSLPLRLTSLVQNSKLDLVTATQRMRAQNAKVVLVNIKLQVEDLPPEFSTKLIHQFPSTETLWNVFKYFESKSGILFTTRAIPMKTSDTSGKLFYEAPIIQTFNCKISDMKDLAKSLSDLGLNSRQENLRVRFETTDIPIDKALEMQEELFGNDVKLTKSESYVDSDQPQHQKPSSLGQEPKNEKTLPGIIDVNEQQITIKKNETSNDELGTNVDTSNTERKVTVYLPEKNPRSIGRVDDEVYNTPLLLAQKYQAQIQKTANPNEGPLLTRDLRHNMENEKLKKLINVEIRIRLPDLTHLQASFKANETIGHVISFVKSALMNPELPFHLFISPPKKYLTDPTQILVSQCKMGPRNLLFLEWDMSSGRPKSQFPTFGILKPEFLSLGTSILNSPDLTLERTSTPTNNTTNTESTSNRDERLRNKTSLSQAQKNKLLKFVKTGRK